GGRLRHGTAALFLLTRAVADGVRVWAVSIVVMIALGTGDVASVALITIMTLLYTLEGGLAAVIRTDVVQLAVYLGGTLAGLYVILQLVPGGAPAVWSLAGQVGKLQVFDFSADFSRPYTFWAGLIGGSFLTMASHGTDQLIVQRLLAARSRTASQAALIFSGLVVFLQFALFLLIGVALFAFYRLVEPSAVFAGSDSIFPTFIVTRMPAGVSGLMVAAVLAAAMSTLSSSLSSLSSTSMVDFYLRRHPETSEARRMALSRRSTLLWAAVLFGFALLSRHGGRVVELGLSIASVSYGALLGVFLLGVLTRKAHERGAMLGMGAGLAVGLYLWLATAVPWTWYVALETLATFSIGYIASLVSPDARTPGEHVA
ncbi:MAG: sodium:solute symporter family transporter, partial [Terriglobales bacterium]